MKFDSSTTAYRLVNGAGSGKPGVYIDHLGTVILVQSEHTPDPSLIPSLKERYPTHSIYLKQMTSYVRALDKETASPVLIAGPAVTGKFPVLENGLTFLLSMDAGYSIGLFLDQRNNRRSIFEMNLKGKTVLNTFAYTCAFSVCAAKAGAIVTSLDLSKKYLEWGRENFQANGLDDTLHDFIYGDVFEWLPRLAKKNRQWDLIILDPPTFSTSKTGRPFQAIKDYPKLLQLARTCLAPGGSMLVCLNTHDASVAEFCELTGIPKILPLPPDFPVAAKQEPHLKSGWLTY